MHSGEAISKELTGFELAIRFHEYQQQALEALLGKHAAGKRRLHLVAPPGAGKTLMGLELIRRIGAKALILAPTRLIAQQWVDKAQRFGVDLKELTGWSELRAEASGWIGSSPGNFQSPMLALTYQRLSRKGQNGLHLEVLELFRQLALAGYQTLVLDECHHLLAHWAQAIEILSRELDNLSIIGLTATPPQDRSSSELADYFKLLGPVDYEILAPAVIKEGHLAPFQDLVYLVKPSEAESQFVSQAHRHLQQLFQLASAASPSLSLWAESWLLEPRDYQGESLSASSVLQQMPDLAIAAQRYLKSLGLALDPLLWCPEIEDPLSFEDQIILLGAYASLCWQGQAPERWQLLRQQLKALGYVWQHGRFISRSGKIERLLAFSGAKLRALQEILRHELQAQQQLLRCLVLTDFETTHAPGGRRASGLADPQAGGAVAILRLLSSHSELKELRPVLVSGQLLLCESAAAPELAEFICLQSGLKPELEDFGDFCSLSSRQSCWQSSFYLGLVTEFLSLGHSRCLIGTRALLGEGWDCPALNTLIDLTAVSSFVSVNQIRGRSLRQDPRQPLKLANNWDIVALLPELAGGFKDFERFERKHAHYYGLSDDAQLEQGIGHVHPLFEQLKRSQLLSRLDELNQEMLRRALERGSAWDAWEVGKPYRNQELACLSWQLPDKLPEAAYQQKTSLLALNSLPSMVTQQHLELSLRLQRSQQIWLGLQVMSWAGVAGVVCLGLTGHQLLVTLTLGLLSQAGLWGYRLQQNRQPLPAAPAVNFLAELAACILAGLQELELIRPELTAADISISRRSDGFERLSLLRATPAESEGFVQALQEILSPLQEQRYLLALTPETLDFEPHWWSPRWQLRPQPTVYLPLPRVFARSREKAEGFLLLFAQQIGRAELIYTRQGPNKELLNRLQRQKSVWISPQKVSIWT